MLVVRRGPDPVDPLLTTQDSVSTDFRVTWSKFGKASEPGNLIALALLVGSGVHYGFTNRRDERIYFRATSGHGSGVRVALSSLVRCPAAPRLHTHWQAQGGLPLGAGTVSPSLASAPRFARSPLRFSSPLSLSLSAACGEACGTVSSTIRCGASIPKPSQHQILVGSVIRPPPEVGVLVSVCVTNGRHRDRDTALLTLRFP